MTYLAILLVFWSYLFSDRNSPFSIQSLAFILAIAIVYDFCRIFIAYNALSYDDFKYHMWEMNKTCS